MDDVWFWLRLVLSTALVIGLAYAASLAARGRYRMLGKGRRLEVLEAIALGPRQHAVLLRVGKRVACIGLSAQDVRPLLIFDEAESAALLEEFAETRAAGEAQSSSSFAGMLRARLRRDSE